MHLVAVFFLYFYWTNRDVFGAPVLLGINSNYDDGMKSFQNISESLREYSFSLEKRGTVNKLNIRY